MKGVNTLIDAFIEILKYEKINAKLNLIGEGNKDFIDTLAKRLIINRCENEVVFHGFREPAYVKDILLKSNLFILPTLMDNSPNSLMESQALGIPSAASNIGGIPSLIEHNYNGFLFKPNDKEEIKRCILDVLSDKNKLLEISKNAQDTAFVRNFPAKVAQITMDVYQKVIKS